MIFSSKISACSSYHHLTQGISLWLPLFCFLSLSHPEMAHCPGMDAPCEVGRAVMNQSSPHLTSSWCHRLFTPFPWKALSPHLSLFLILRIHLEMHCSDRKSCQESIREGWSHPDLPARHLGRSVFIHMDLQLLLPKFQFFNCRVYSSPAILLRCP